MTPSKTGRKKGERSSGSFQMDRVFSAPVGRICQATGARTLKEFHYRERLALKLGANGQLEELLALKTGALTFPQLVDADRHGYLHSPKLLAQVKLRQNLWTTIDEVVPEPDRATAKTRYRYWSSLQKFAKRATSLGAAATVADLEKVDWTALRASWGTTGKPAQDATPATAETPARPARRAQPARPASAADWNHLRRAISWFLTRLLGDVHHPSRRQIVKAIPLAKEAEREVSVAAELFWRILDKTPEHAQPCYVALILTGMRLGEYLSCTESNLDAEARAIRFTQTKPEKQAAVVYVDPDFWPWVERAIPAPIQEKWIREHFKRALEALEIDRLAYRLHDLRHGFAQIASDEGTPTAQIQSALRHANPAMSRRYEKTQAKRNAAVAVGNVLRRARENP